MNCEPFKIQNNLHLTCDEIIFRHIGARTPHCEQVTTAKRHLFVHRTCACLKCSCSFFLAYVCNQKLILIIKNFKFDLDTLNYCLSEKSCVFGKFYFIECRLVFWLLICLAINSNASNQL